MEEIVIEVVGEVEAHEAVVGRLREGEETVGAVELAEVTSSLIHITVLPVELHRVLACITGYLRSIKT